VHGLRVEIVASGLILTLPRKRAVAVLADLLWIAIPFADFGGRTTEGWKDGSGQLSRQIP